MTTQNENTKENSSSKNPAQNLTQEDRSKGGQHSHQGGSHSEKDQKSGHTLTEEDHKKGGEHSHGNKS